MPTSFSTPRLSAGHLSLSAAALVVSLASPGPSVLAQAPDTARVTRPVVLSASGGISKGAYQAGVNWVTVEFLRRQRDGRFRSEMGLTGPPYSLVSATGASAGNINALMTAIAWCTGAPGQPGDTTGRIDAESSLFWKMWVNTGIAELLPELRSGKTRSGRELAAFDRESFKTLLPHILSDMSTARPVEGCDVPVGITMTRVSPVKAPVVGTVTAEVQRFAAVFRIGTIGDENKAAIGIVEPGKEIREARSLGALALVPALANPATRTKERLDHVFDFVLASSSFPVAFAPRSLDYLSGGLIHPRYGGPAGIDRALFSDGGAFDNNPFALAVRLYELDAKKRADPVEVIYANPYAYRGPFEKTRRPVKPNIPRSGLGANLQLLSGMYAAAGEYELQTLGRMTGRDQELGGAIPGVATPTVLRSTRSTGIYGEHLNSFAAFLGRGMREYDFYTGVYDGLELIARNFLCRSAPQAQLDACVEREHRRLVDGNSFALDGYGQEIQRWHWEREYAPSSRVPWTAPAGPAPGTPEADRLLLLRRLHEAMERQDGTSFPAECDGDFLSKQLCSTNFDRVLETLAKRSDVQHVAERLQRHCKAVYGESAGRANGSCTVDEPFQDLLEDPAPELDELLELSLDNLWRAEQALNDANESDLSAWVEAGHAVYRSFNSDLRRGLHVNPSTARITWRTKADRARSIGALLLPNYVMVYGFSPNHPTTNLPRTANGIRRVGGVVGGWYPLVWYTGWHATDVVTAIETHVYRMEESKERGWTVSPGAMLRTRAFPLIPSAEAGVFLERHQFPIVTVLGSDRDPLLHLGVGLLGDHVRMTMRAGHDRPTVYTFGLGDVNGLVYWWLFR